MNIKSLSQVKVPSSLALFLLAITLKPSLLKYKPSIWTPVIAVLDTALIWFIVWITYKLFPSVHTSYKNYASLVQKPILIMNILWGICAGFGEEFMMRGVLQDSLSKWLNNKVIAVIVVSLIFGFLHNGWQKDTMKYAVLTAVIGSIFGTSFALTNDLWAVVFAHALVNTIGVFWKPSKKTSYGRGLFFMSSFMNLFMNIFIKSFYEYSQYDTLFIIEQFAKTGGLYEEIKTCHHQR